MVNSRLPRLRPYADSWVRTRILSRVGSHFFIVVEAIPYRSFATGVLPVKEIFFTALLSQISLPTDTTFFCVVTMLITPSGKPARLASFLGGQPFWTFTRRRAYLGNRKGRERGLWWGLDDCCATGSQCGAKFSCYHRRGEVPGCEDTAVRTVITQFAAGDRTQLTRHLGNTV